MNKSRVIIIGSGPAGLTAAIYASRAELSPIVIEGHTPGGQLMGTTFVENWPGEKSILGPQLMSNIKQHAQYAGARFVSEEVIELVLDQSPFLVRTSKNTELKTDSLIIASGASPNKLFCTGEEKYWGKGVTTCAVCDGAFYPDKKVIIVGGGDTAMEDASFMTKYTNNITIIHIRNKLNASPAMQQRVINNKNIHIIYNHTVTEIKGDEKKVTSVIITNQKTEKSEELPANVVFLAIGQTPNTALVNGKVDLDKYGYIVTKEGTSETSVDGVFAAGDVTDRYYRQAITASGTGCMAAMDVQRYLEALKD